MDASLWVICLLLIPASTSILVAPHSMYREFPELPLASVQTLIYMFMPLLKIPVRCNIHDDVRRVYTGANKRAARCLPPSKFLIPRERGLRHDGVHAGRDALFSGTVEYGK